MGSDPYIPTDDSFASETWTFVDDAPTPRLPKLPVILGAVCLILGVLFALVSSAQPEARFPALAMLGYILTPLVTALLLAWALSQHRIASASDTYDMAAGRRWVRLAMGVALLGFVVGAALTYRIGLWVAQLPTFTGGTQ